MSEAVRADGEQAKVTRMTAEGAATRGKTIISDEVVSIIAARAAEQVEGVHKIGQSSLRSLVSRLGRHPGVAADVGLKEAAVDISIVVVFGHPINQVAETLREQIINDVEYMTGRKVIEVNVHVVDVQVPKPVKAEPVVQRRVE